MVLIGLIIIAVVLMALMVPGMPGTRWKLPVPMPAAGPDRERKIREYGHRRPGRRLTRLRSGQMRSQR
jgi:hypothetical protein